MARLFRLILPAAGLILAACSGPAPESSTEPGTLPADCVPLAEGLYEFRDGRFLAVEGAPDAPASQRRAWANEILYALKAAGLEAVDITFTGPVAIVTGTAPDRARRDYLFTAARTAIEAHPGAGAAGLFILDAVSLEAGPPAAGRALLGVQATGLSLPACQGLFDGLLAGEILQFETGTANISPVSAPLLDTLAATAILCGEFALEIASHTDARGAEAYNLTLSQSRADAVRSRLIDSGVDAGRLVARGYGESQPIDPSGTARAHGLNRRTEIRVTGPASVPETEDDAG